MTGINHIVTGGIIGALVPQPLVAIPLAFLSHFILDMLPHWGDHPDDHLKNTPSVYRLIVVDTILSVLFLALLLILQPVNWPVIFASGFVAWTPDLVWVPNYVRVRRGLKQRSYNSLMRFHKYIQWAEKPKLSNAVIEAMWLVAATTIFFRVV
jgi:hypothetical protein